MLAAVLGAASCSWLAPVVLTAVRLVDPAPEPEDVKAGWTALVVFLLLGLAVVLLGFSLVKQLRKAQAAADAGVYAPPDEPSGPSGHSTEKGAPPAP